MPHMDSKKSITCKRSYKRSIEKKKDRNKINKQKRKQKKQKLKQERDENTLLMESELLKLRRNNRLLQTTLHHLKKRTSHRCLRKNGTTSMLQHNKDRASGVMRLFINFSPHQFKKQDFEEGIFIGKGVFGTVKKSFMKSIRSNVAVKSFSELYNDRCILAEAAVYHKLSNHSNFPFFYGLLENRSLILEYVDNSVTFQELLNSPVKKFNLKDVCMQLVRAMSHFHVCGLLHNDLHCGNVLLRKNVQLKIIDFGKCCAAEEPISYSIKPGSEKQKKYNLYHRHLAYELRHIPGSKVTYETDIFSVGYIFEKLGDKFSDRKLSEVAQLMTNENPELRPSLSDVLFILKSVRH